MTVNAALMKPRGHPTNREISLESQVPGLHTDGRRAGDPVSLRSDWKDQVRKEKR